MKRFYFKKHINEQFKLRIECWCCNERCKSIPLLIVFLYLPVWFCFLMLRIYDTKAGTKNAFGKEPFTNRGKFKKKVTKSKEIKLIFCYKHLGLSEIEHKQKMAFYFNINLKISFNRLRKMLFPNVLYIFLIKKKRTQKELKKNNCDLFNIFLFVYVGYFFSIL